MQHGVAPARGPTPTGMPYGGAAPAPSSSYYLAQTGQTQSPQQLAAAAAAANSVSLSLSRSLHHRVPSVPPPPAMNGHHAPPPAQPGDPRTNVIYPSHPAHPQHASWQMKQIQVQQQAQAQYANGAPPSQPAAQPPGNRPQPNGIPHPSHPPPPPPSAQRNPTTAPSPASAAGQSHITGMGYRPPPPPILHRTLSNPSPVRPPPSQHGPILAAQLAATSPGPLTAIPSSAPGHALHRLSQFSEAMTVAQERGDIEDLRDVVADFFTTTGVVKFGLHDTAVDTSKVFEIPCSAFPRFQHINALVGVVQSCLHPQFVREYALTVPAPSAAPSAPPIHVGYLLQSTDTTWATRLQQGVRIDLVGSLMVHFLVTVDHDGKPGPLRIELIEFVSRGHDEYVVRDAIVTEKIERIWSDGPSPSPTSASFLLPTPLAESPSKRDKDDDDDVTVAPSSKRKKTVTKKKAEAEEAAALLAASVEGGRSTVVKGALIGEKALGTERIPGYQTQSWEQHHLPSAPVGSFGVTEMGMRCLEIAESVAQLQDLIAYSTEAKVGPIEALSRFASHHQHAMNHARQLSGAPIAATSQSNPFYSSQAPPTASMTIPHTPQNLPPRTPTPSLLDQVATPHSNGVPSPAKSMTRGGSANGRPPVRAASAASIAAGGVRSSSRGQRSNTLDGSIFAFGGGLNERGMPVEKRSL